MNSILIENKESIAWITFNRPQAFNSFNREMALAFQEALDAANQDKLVRAIVIRAEVKQVLTPAWTTDMITEEGRQALEKYGIAAPLSASADKAALNGEKNQVRCTNCGSTNTKMVSRFGSTACKALFQCNDCHEPFDYFKCLR
jgi:ring-1,2-phenylacetyl-CoA epoxidase subunit PaaD